MGGFTETEILDMPVTVFRLYSKAARRAEARTRYLDITNTLAAIGMALGGKKGGSDDFLTDLQDEMEQD